MTTVNSKYIDYAPIWEWCINKAYPNTFHIKYFVVNSVPPYRASLERLLRRPDGDWDYVYITDVDMMILPETPGLIDFHLSEMRESGLCYSNSIRGKEVYGHERVTGLHFVGREWYNVTSKARNEYMAMVDSKIIGFDRFEDELVLRKVIVESGLSLPEKKPLLERHHGIHMGTIRAYRYYPHQKKLSEQLRVRITPRQASQWQRYLNDGLQNIIDYIGSDRIKWEYDYLRKWTLRRASV